MHTAWWLFTTLFLCVVASACATSHPAHADEDQMPSVVRVARGGTLDDFRALMHTSDTMLRDVYDYLQHAPSEEHISTEHAPAATSTTRAVAAVGTEEVCGTPYHHNVTGMLHFSPGSAGVGVGGECVWAIEPFRTSHDVCGNCVRVTASHLQLGVDDVLELSSVPFDTLTWDATPEVVLLGRDVFTSHVSAHPAMYVRFTAGEDAGEDVVVELLYTVGLCDIATPEGSDMCSGTVTLTDVRGSFESNAFGTTYNDDLFCTWYIEPEGTTPSDCVVLSFFRFEVEEGYDLVAVHDGIGVDYPMLPSGRPVTDVDLTTHVYASGPALTVEFTSDYSFGLGGFSAQYAVEPCQVDPCSTIGDCDTCAREAECRWCGSPTLYTSGTCLSADAPDECGASQVAVSWIGQCPGYPTEDSLFVLEAFETLVFGPSLLATMSYDDLLPRGLWCSYEANPLRFDVAILCETGTNRIESLTFEEPFHNTTLPRSIGTLPRLRHLRSNVYGLGRLPNVFHEDMILETLTLVRSEVSELPPSLSEVKSLRHLRIEGGLKVMKVPDFAAWPNMDKIEIRTQRQEQLFDWRLFMGSSKLRSFTFEKSQMQGHIDGELVARTAPLLERFDVGQNQLTGDVTPLLRLPYLEVLDCNGSRVDLDLSQMNSTRLRMLRMAHALVRGSLDAFRDLEELQYISLQNTGLTGRVPSFLWRPSLRKLALSGNDLYGPIEVDEDFDIARTFSVDLSRNRLSGAIPRVFANSALTNRDIILSLAFNEFDSIPDEMLGMQAAVLDLEEAFAEHVRHPLPSTVLQFSGQYLNLAGCGFVGEFPRHTPGWHAMRHLILRNNELTGTVPKVRFATGLLHMDVAFNRFEHLDEEDGFAVGSTISHLDLSHNAFSFDVVPHAVHTIKTFHGLQVLNLERNDFGGDWSTLFVNFPVVDITLSNNPRLHVMLSEVLFSPQTRAIRAEGCRFRGNIDVFAAPRFSEVQELSLGGNEITGLLHLPPRLRELRVEGNQIRGGLPEVLPQGLERLEVTGNMLDVPIPDTLDVPQSVISMRLGGNAGMRNTSVVKDPLQPASVSAAHHDGLPKFLRYLPQLVTQAGAHFSCFSVGGVDSLALETVEIDAGYTDHVACPCNVNYWGRAPCCEECPEHAVCEQDTVVPIAAEGWFGEVLALDSGVHGAGREEGGDECASVDHVNVVFRECRFVEPDKTACLDPKHRAEDADPTDPNQCAGGYTDRLCAQCDDDHFEWGLKCKRCNAAVKTLFPFVLALAIVAVYALLFKAVSSRKGTLKILVFHLQMIALLSATGNPIPALLLTTSEATSFANMSIPGVECYAPGVEIKEKFTAAFVMPFVLLGVSVLVYVCGVLLRRVSTSLGNAAQLRSGVWFHLNVRVYMFLLVAYYISLSRWLLSVLPCQHGYMSVAPYVACGSGDHNTMVGMAVVGIIVYVIGFPAGVSWMLWRHRTELRDVSRQRMWGFLYSSYVDDKWWWELVMIVRKLVIVCVIALSPYKSAALPVLVFLVLALSAMLQYRFQPFVSPTDNRLEIASLVIILLTYFLALTFFIPNVTNGTLASVVVFLLNLAWVGSAVVVLSRRKLKGVASRSSVNLASPLLTQNDVAQELAEPLPEQQA